MSTDSTEASARYRVIQKLDEGQSAVVYHAEDTFLSRQVALKCAKKDLIATKPQYLAIFAREAKYLASLNHPNIVPLYEFCETTDGPTIVMRLAQTNLHRILDQESERNMLALSRIVRQLATALDYCVNQGVAHRDVTLANVLIDYQNHVYLTDFGLAARLDNDADWLQPVGAKPFLSPEMFTDRYTGGTLDRRMRSDQFSLGVLLYYALTRHLPHDPVTYDVSGQLPHWNDCTALRLFRGHAPIPCSERNASIPSQVDQVIFRMLSVDPDNRYPSNTVASQSFEDALAGQGNRDITVFISYSKFDKPIVEQLVIHLENKGFNIWWDRQIEYGVDWEDEVEQAMLKANIMLVVVSAHSANCSEVKNEWRYWLNCLKQPLITLVLEDCRIPYRLYPRQHISAQGKPVEEVGNEVAIAIKKAKESLQSHTVISEPVSTVEAPSERPYGYSSEIDLKQMSLNIESLLRTVPNAHYISHAERQEDLLIDSIEILEEPEEEKINPSGTED